MKKIYHVILIVASIYMLYEFISDYNTGNPMTISFLVFVLIYLATQALDSLLEVLDD